MKKFAILLMLVLTGCGNDRAVEDAKVLHDKESFAKPALVGTLPNGQQVHRVTLESTPNGENHYVYFTDNVTTVNVTQTTGSAARKTVHNKVYVEINGQQIPLNDAKQAVEQAEQELSASR
jgi:hypothetical protein